MDWSRWRCARLHILQVRSREQETSKPLLPPEPHQRSVTGSVCSDQDKSGSGAWLSNALAPAAPMPQSRSAGMDQMDTTPSFPADATSVSSSERRSTDTGLKCARQDTRSCPLFASQMLMAPDLVPPMQYTPSSVAARHVTSSARKLRIWGCSLAHDHAKMPPFPCCAQARPPRAILGRYCQLRKPFCGAKVVRKGPSLRRHPGFAGVQDGSPRRLITQNKGGDDDDQWLEDFWAGNSNPFVDDEDDEPKRTQRGRNNRKTPNRQVPPARDANTWDSSLPTSWDLPPKEIPPWAASRAEAPNTPEGAAAAEELHRPGDVIVAPSSSPALGASGSGSLGASRSSTPSSSSSSKQRAYRVIRKLGQGGFGSTYEAVEVAADEGGSGREGERVAIKAVSLRRSRNWKVLELFEREARVLWALSHPGIPSYKDYFEVDKPDDRVFYIVQRLARGRSLGQLVRDGWRPDEATVRAIALQLLAILDYLESRRPPVVHRDIKPDNIVIDLDATPGGVAAADGAGPGGEQGADGPHQLVNLVDFGAVQDMAASSGTRLPSTMIGTFGYVAPEVYQGRGSTRSDQYALGTSLLFVLSGGAAPSDFPQERLKPKFQGRVVMSHAMERFLDRLLEPAPEDRFGSAREAMGALMGGEGRARQQKEAEALRQQRAMEEYQRQAVAMGGGLVGPDQMLGARQVAWSDGGVPRRPAGTQVELTKDDGVLTVSIPARMLSGDTVASGGFAIAWNTFVFFWTQSAILGGAPILFTLFAAPFWVVGLQLARSAFGDAFVKTSVRIDRDYFKMCFSALGRDKEISGRTKDITDARIFTESVVNGEPRTVCEIVEGVNNHRFGGSLTIREKEWVMHEISSFLDEVN
eukprot:jgi/Mesvir1/24685/Mv21977-RA.2